MTNLRNSAPLDNGSAEKTKKRPPWSQVLDRIDRLEEKIDALRGQKDEGRNLDVSEAAEIASVSRRKMDNLIHAGEVPSLKIGRRRLIPNRAFRAWLRRQAEVQR